MFCVHVHIDLDDRKVNILVHVYQMFCIEVFAGSGLHMILIELFKQDGSTKICL